MKYETIVFDAHARQRMAERHVQESHVIAVIERPDVLYPSYRGSLVADRRGSLGDSVRVVYVEQPTVTGLAAYVITVIRVGSEP